MSEETTSAFFGERDDALRVSMLLDRNGIAAEVVEHSLSEDEATSAAHSRES